MKLSCMRFLDEVGFDGGELDQVWSNEVGFCEVSFLTGL